MSLTVGTGPFGHAPTGRFDFDAPREITFVEVHRPRVRGIKDDDAVVDSREVRLVYRTGSLPRYAFPAADVSGVETQPEPAVPGYVTVAWDAVDRWLEEESERIVHPHDPYHRIDILDSSAGVVVRVNGEVAAESTAARVLFETALPPRYYLPPADVHAELTADPELRTGCAYKGYASYFDVAGAETIAWTYTEPLPEAEPIRGRLCFFQEREEVELEVDGAVQERPSTQWAKRDWIARYRRAA